MSNIQCSPSYMYLQTVLSHTHICMIKHTYTHTTLLQTHTQTGTFSLPVVPLKAESLIGLITHSDQPDEKPSHRGERKTPLFLSLCLQYLFPFFLDFCFSFSQQSLSLAPVLRDNWCARTMLKHHSLSASLLRDHTDWHCSIPLKEYPSPQK